MSATVERKIWIETSLQAIGLRGSDTPLLSSIGEVLLDTELPDSGFQICVQEQSCLICLEFRRSG